MSASGTTTRATGGSSAARLSSSVRHKVAGAAKIRLKELPVFSRMIAAMLDAGIPLVQSLGALEEQTQSKMFRSVIRGVRLRVEGGAEFSAALKEYPEVFDELYCSMMRAGEAGGLLSEIAGRVAKYLESSAKLRRKVKSAMMYPTVVLCLAVVIATAMIMFLVPVFSDIYKDFGASLPKPTQFLVAVSRFLKSYFLYAAAGVVLLMFLFRKWRQTGSGAYAWDHFILKIPLIG